MRTVEQTLIEAGRAYTIAAATGYVVSYTGAKEDGAAELRLAKYERKPEQEWLFDRVGENSYRIHCRANGKVIDLMMAGTDNGTWLHLWDDVLGSSQVWTLLPVNDGTVRIVSQWASGKCLDTVGIGSAEGAILQIWQESPGADQLWTIRAVKDRKAEEPAAPAVEAAPAEQVKAEAPAPAEKAKAEEPAAPAAEEKPARRTRAKKADSAAAAPAETVKAEAPAAEKAKDEAPAAGEKPKRRACRTKKAAEPAAEAEAPKKRAARTKKAAAEAEAALAAPAAEEKPARRTRAKKAEQ